MKLDTAIEESFKVKKLMTEEVDRKEKKQLSDIVNKKKSGKFNIAGVPLETKAGAKEMLITMSGKDTDPVIFALTDIADALGLDFDYGVVSGKQRFAIKF